MGARLKQQKQLNKNQDITVHYGRPIPSLFKHLLIEIGVPFNAVDNKQFWYETKKCRSNDKAKHVNCVKYNKHIDAFYLTFKETVYEVMLDKIASIYGCPFINLIRDIWNSNSVVFILGA